MREQDLQSTAQAFGPTYSVPQVNVVRCETAGPSTRVRSTLTIPSDDMGYLTPVALRIPPRKNGHLPVNKFGYVEIDKTARTNY